MSDKVGLLQEIEEFFTCAYDGKKYREHLAASIETSQGTVWVHEDNVDSYLSEYGKSQADIYGAPARL